jgi:hypothetical protein
MTARHVCVALGVLLGAFSSNTIRAATSEETRTIERRAVEAVIWGGQYRFDASGNVSQDERQGEPDTLLVAGRRESEMNTV